MTELSWTDDTSLYLDTPAITLVVKAGSAADALSLTLSSITVTVGAGDIFRLVYPGPNPGRLANDGGFPACNPVGSENILTVNGPSTVTITPSVTPVCASSGGVGGGGGGGSSGPTAPFAVNAAGPAADVFVLPGDTVPFTWEARGDAAQWRISLSPVGGTRRTIIVTTTASSRHYDWRVPGGMPVGRYAVIFEALRADGSLISTASVAGLIHVSRPIASGGVIPAVDPTVAGAWGADAARAATVSIDDDVAAIPTSALQPACAPGSLVRASLPAVYYCAQDGKRYVFPNQRIYDGWYPDFSGVRRISDQELAAFTIGGNVNYRPGVRMVKITTDPTVYVISRGGTLRAVPSEATAASLYGVAWNTQVDDLPDAFFFNYQIGSPLTETDIIPMDPTAPPSSSVPTPLSGMPHCNRAITFSAFLDLEMVGGEVGPLQALLNCLGYLAQEPTDYYGPATMAAVRAFQAANRIEAAGYVGPATRAALNAFPAI